MNYDSKHTIMLDPQTGYDLVAEEYKKYHDHLDSFEKGFFLRLLPPHTDTLDIVDLGAGDGRLYKIFQKENIKFQSYTAVDISEKMLNNHPGDVTKITSDLEDTLPLEDNTFDIAFSFFVIEHIKDIDHFFGETERILKPGGMRIIGYFLQRREFIRKIKKENYKIQSIKYRIQDLEKTAQKNLFKTHTIPIEEKGTLLGYLLVCEK